MNSSQIDSDWKVEWAAPIPGENGYFDNLMLTREQAIEYGDELIWALRVDGQMLRARGLDPAEPFAWKIEDGKILTKQISRQTFEAVADSDRDDSTYASSTLRHRARRKARKFG